METQESLVEQYWEQLYDQLETQTEDVALLREMIGNSKPLKILELFCGNGRIFIPLAQDGHTIVGIDKSEAMLSGARRKVQQCSPDVQKNITLRHADITTTEWPTGFDLVILGANCFYELATAQEQEQCIQWAHQSLKPGGYLYLDNDHMEGELAADWCNIGQKTVRPTYTCPDGATIFYTMETLSVDRVKRIWRARYTTEVTTPNGEKLKAERIQQKQPPSTQDMHHWLNKHGFETLHLWGDRKKAPYTDASDRAIFWAHKRSRKNTEEIN